MGFLRVPRIPGIPGMTNLMVRTSGAKEKKNGGGCGVYRDGGCRI